MNGPRSSSSLVSFLEMTGITEVMRIKNRQLHSDQGDIVTLVETPTTAQLRANIDSGSTGEKVGFSDPAAAPLGTDDEAAGQTPTPKERLMAAKSQPKFDEPTHPANGLLLYAVLVFLFFALTGVIWYAAR